jgi:hypothetical protein
LPEVFEQAVQQWCDYFRVDPRLFEHWRITGYLMGRKERFEATGLLPPDLPPFLNGYQRGAEIWVYEQPSSFYRRHLVLHEGTHAFMERQFGAAGPPWYMEGMAELLGTHRWEHGALQLAHFPTARDEVDHWGRIRIVQDEVRAGRSMSLAQIIAYGPSAHLRNEPYAWCWAACAFLDGHPRFSARFRQLVDHVRQSPPEFNDAFYTLFKSDLGPLLEQWQLFVRNLDYGYDLVREAVVYEPAVTPVGDTAVVEIAADRGWQSTGFRIEPNRRYRIEASGRFQLAREPAIWWSEPDGVTIRYHAGRPLGMLLAAVVDPTRGATTATPLADPEPIGSGRELEARGGGILFLRVNDHPAELSDNAGHVRAEIRPVRSDTPGSPGGPPSPTPRLTNGS